MNYLPNVLTITRIVSIPFIVMCFFYEEHTTIAVIFSIACITDFLDGYLARELKAESRMGRILDPIADKLLVNSCFLMLVGFRMIEGINIIAVLVISCREILIAGLREITASYTANESLSVLKLSKIKTALQMVTIVITVLHNKITGANWLSANHIYLFSMSMLWISVVITITTATQYIIQFSKLINKHQP